jgi:hypothetical protein
MGEKSFLETLRRIALNLIRKSAGKDSRRLKRSRRLGRPVPCKSHRGLIYSPIPLAVNISWIWEGWSSERDGASRIGHVTALQARAVFPAGRRLRRPIAEKIREVDHRLGDQPAFARRHEDGIGQEIVPWLRGRCRSASPWRQRGSALACAMARAVIANPNRLLRAKSNELPTLL